MAGKLVKMQVNTGAAVSLVPECVYQQLKQPPQFGECDVKLQREVPSIIVARGGKLGRDWISHLGMGLSSVHEVQAKPFVDSILGTYASVFKAKYFYIYTQRVPSRCCCQQKTPANK